ncbi:MAG TPA: DUF2567 domain-containing protein [Micromonosporaceae bacterium]
MSSTAPEEQQHDAREGAPPDADPAPGEAATASQPGEAAPDAAADEALSEPAPASEPSTGRRRFADPLVALGVVAGLAVLGLPLGWLWSVAAPRVPIEMTSDGPMLADPQPEQYIADEGWYILLTVAVGALAALLVWALLRRHRGPVLLVGLTLGSAFGGVVAWWLGSHLGLSHYHDLLQHAPVGSRFSRPVGLRVQRVGLWHGWLPLARGDVLSEAIAATLVYALLAGFSPSASLNTSPGEDDDPGERGEAVPVPNPSAPPEVSSDWSATRDRPTTPVPPGSGAAAPPRG